MSPVKEFTARHRFAHITARKARYVADLIRGRSVNEALELLQFTPNRGAAFYGKVLRSAVANASHDEEVNINRLMISECRADDGPLLQGRMRYRPGPQGRAMPFSKRLSHLTVKVQEVPDEKAPRRRSGAPGAAEKVETPGSPAGEGAAAATAAKPKARAKKGSKGEEQAPGAQAQAEPKKPARKGGKTGGAKKENKA
jgi:large subunit ribosomal protein L22